MNIEEKKTLAQRLIDENRIGEVVDLYREIVEEEPTWGNYRTLMVGINTNAYLINEIGGLEKAIRVVEESIELAIKLSYNDELMEAVGDEVIELYAKACKIKGQSIYENNQTDEDCVQPLMEAIKYGLNEANYYLAMHYFFVSKNGNYDENPQQFVKYCGDYLDNLTGNEDPERIVHLAEYMIALYENGDAVKRDLNQVAKYRSIQKKYSGEPEVEITNTSQIKKKGLFGFLK